jgi:RNA polymerase sigma-70 factor (ECF subfamily)
MLPVTLTVALTPEQSGSYAVLTGSGETASRAEEERRLIARCALGEAEAFRPLVVRYQRVAFSVSYRMLGSRPDAEDVTQQAMVDAFHAIDRFRNEGKPNAFSVWLLRIVINRSKDVLKSKRWTEKPLRSDGEVAGNDAVFAHRPVDPELNVAGNEQRRRLEAALLALPAKYREALILKDVEDLPYEEMRAILRLPITTLKIRVVRARARLRELLGDREGVA